MYFNKYNLEDQVKTISLEWELSMEDKIKIITRLKRVKTFERVFNPKFNLTSSFHEETMKHGKAPTDHFIYTIKGRTGSGKSAVGMNILYWLYNDKIDINQIVFNHLQQKRFLKIEHKNTTILRDEQTRRVGMGSMAENLEIQNWDETLRKQGLNFIYIAPTDRFHGTAHKNLEFVASNRKKRISMFALYDGMEHSKYYTGYVLFYIPTIKWWQENGNNMWMKYQRIKDKFNEKTLNDSHGVDWGYYIEEIKDHKMWNEYINQNKLKAIVIDLYIYQPKDFRDTIITMYLARVGLKRKASNGVNRPPRCPECGGKSIRWYNREGVYKCMTCNYVI